MKKPTQRQAPAERVERTAKGVRMVLRSVRIETGEVLEVPAYITRNSHSLGWQVDRGRYFADGKAGPHQSLKRAVAALEQKMLNDARPLYRHKRGEEQGKRLRTGCNGVGFYFDLNKARVSPRLVITVLYPLGAGLYRLSLGPAHALARAQIQEATEQAVALRCWLLAQSKNAEPAALKALLARPLRDLINIPEVARQRRSQAPITLDWEALCEKYQERVALLEQRNGEPCDWPWPAWGDEASDAGPRP